MTQVVFDEYQIRQIHPLNKRFERIKEWYKTDDESIRWDCVWLAGEMWDDVTKDFKEKIADFMVAILRNDDNGIVKHEAAFQIGLRNMRDKIGDLLKTINGDDNSITRHEAIEALGLMRVHTVNNMLELWSKSPDKAVSETAKFVLKRLERLKDKGAYREGEPL